MVSAYLVIGAIVGLVVAFCFASRQSHSKNAFGKRRGRDDLCSVVERARKISLKQKSRAAGMLDAILRLHGEEAVQKKCGVSLTSYVQKMRTPTR